VNDALSRKDLSGNGNDLIAVDGGATVFGPNWARLKDGKGYKTPFNVTPGAYSAFVVCDRPSSNPDGSNNPPYYFSPASTPISSPAGYGGPRLFAGYFQDSAPAAKTGQIFPGNPATNGPWITADRGTGFDPNNVYQPRGDYGGNNQGLQALLCFVEHPLSMDCHLEEERGIKSFYGANATTAPSTTPFPIQFPFAVPQDAYTRFSLAAIYGRDMVAAEVRNVNAALRAHNTARGWRD